MSVAQEITETRHETNKQTTKQQNHLRNSNKKPRSKQNYADIKNSLYKRETLLKAENKGWLLSIIAWLFFLFYLYNVMVLDEVT